MTGMVRYEKVCSASVSTAVRSKCSALESSGTEISGMSGTTELTAGKYYLDGELAVGSGEELVLNNSAGDVSLCVDGDVNVRGGVVRVTDTDGGRVNVYQMGDEYSVTNGGNVSVPDETATKLWFYGRNTVDVTISDSRVVGVVYMPAGRLGSGRAEISTHADVYGAVVSGLIDMKSGGQVHYDQALTDEPAVEDVDSITVVSYLHVSITEVEFEE